VKFLVDNNLPPSLAKALSALAETRGDLVVHLRDKFSEQVADIDWMKTLSDEGGWAAITQDRLTRNPAEREVLRQMKLTAFILLPGWASLGFWDKAWRLTRWWPSIASVAAHSIGIFEVPINFGGGRLRQVKV
jgi:hypothetical protein